MLNPLAMLEDGGVQYLALLLGLSGPVAAIVLTRLSLKNRVPTVLHLVLPLLITAIGFVGTSEALAAALLASVSLLTSVVSLAIAATIRTNEPHGNPDLAADAAELRAGVGILAVTAAAHVGWGFWFANILIGRNELARASAASRHGIATHTEEVLAMVGPTAGAVMLLLGIATAVVVRLSARSLDSRAVASLGIAALVAGLVSLAPLLPSVMNPEPEPSFGEKRAAILDSWGIRLPATSKTFRQHSPGLMISVGDQVRVQDKVVSESQLASAVFAAKGNHTRAVIEADAATRFSELLPILTACRSAGITTVAFAAHPTYAGAIVDLEAAFEDERAPPPAGEQELLELRATPLPEGFRLQTQLGAADAMDASGVTVLACQLKDRYPDVETAFIHVTADMSVVKYFRLAEALIEDPHDKEDGRPRVLFPHLILRTDPVPSGG